jgi:hypothetical protein
VEDDRICTNLLRRNGRFRAPRLPRRPAKLLRITPHQEAPSIAPKSQSDPCAEGRGPPCPAITVYTCPVEKQDFQIERLAEALAGTEADGPVLRRAARLRASVKEGASVWLSTRGISLQNMQFSPSRARFMLAHDLLRKPVPTFRDHALMRETMR